MRNNDLFSSLGVLIDIIDSNNFLKIKETLTRIGIASKEEKKLVQSCHILHKRTPEGKSVYALVHFKEMFLLDKKKSSLTDQDRHRRNKVAALLEDWGLIKILEDVELDAAVTVKVIPYKEKSQWKLVEKYKIGKKSPKE